MRVMFLTVFFFFFYWGESENVTRAIDFLRLNSDNREFAAFLLSDLGR